MSKTDLRDNGAYRDRQQFETKRIPTVVKEIDAEHGIVQHYVAIVGNEDDGGDVIVPGAFAKTIAENARRVRVLDCHNYDSALRVVGKPLALREISQEELPAAVLAVAPTATGALLATTQYALDTTAGREVFELIKGGYLPETSIGYDALQEGYEQRERNGKKYTVRLLKEIRLWEYSNVLWGMNPATTTVSAKQKDGNIMQKRVVPVQDLPFAPREAEWDGTAAEARVREWASNDAGELDWEQYRRAFMWYDSEEPEQLGSYHLGVGDIVDGELVIVPRGVFSVAAVLRGSRGATLPYLSDADRARVTANVNRYYALMRTALDDEGIVSPFEAEGQPQKTRRNAYAEKLPEPARDLYSKACAQISSDTAIQTAFNKAQQRVIKNALLNALEVINSDAPQDLLFALHGFYEYIEPPEADEARSTAERKEYGDSGITLGDYIAAYLRTMYDDIVNGAMVYGKISREQRREMATAIESALDVLSAQMPQGVAGIAHNYYNTLGVSAVHLEAKSGRAISKANGDRIATALQAMHDAIAALQALLLEAGIDVEDVAPPEVPEAMGRDMELARLQLLATLQTL